MAGPTKAELQEQLEAITADRHAMDEARVAAEDDLRNVGFELIEMERKRDQALAESGRKDEFYQEIIRNQGRKLRWCPLYQLQRAMRAFVRNRWVQRVAALALAAAAGAAIESSDIIEEIPWP